MAYENDRRAGKTQPGKIEMIEADDKRHARNRGRFINGEPIAENRADRRARGWRSNFKRSPFRQSAKAYRERS